MIPYKLKIAIRFFSRAKSFTLLNMVGLVIGISLFILISMLLNYELSFDGFHVNKNKILQVCEQDLKSGESLAHTGLPLPLTLKNDFPEVKYVAGVLKILYRESNIKYQDTEYSGYTGASVDPDFFNIFQYEIILGDVQNVLKAPDNIAVSKSMSTKIFGDENPIGKTIALSNYNFTITQLFKDIPDNSSVKFDILFSEKIREIITPDYKVAWWNGGIKTYVILQNNSLVEDFNAHLKEIPDRYYPDFLKGRSTYFTIPFAKAHFDTSILNSDPPAISHAYLLLLGSIAFIVLLIACVNYVNLTLARAFQLNMDAGIRRIVGARSQEIIKLQVLYASLSIFAALLISIPVSLLGLPYFEQLAERPLAGQIYNPYVWLFALGASAVIVMISGFIPGKIFSKINPALIIKSKGAFIKTYKEVHNGLLIFQFSLTIALIISQFFIVKQISFMQNADLGFDNNNLLSVNLGNIDAGYEERYAKSRLYKEELEKIGAQAGFSTGTITENIPGYYYQNSFTVNPVDAAVDECLVISTAVDKDYCSVFGVNIIKGRFFSDEYSTDRHSFIINETAMKKFGWKDIEGKFLKLGHESKKYPVVGVMKDIHITTLKQEVSPMLYRFGQHNNFPAFLTFRVTPGNAGKAVALLKKEWSAFFPEIPFDYLDVKETYYKNYEEEYRLSKIVGIFAVLAIILSLFGLLGLIIFYAESRTKEIGIRKVNGARVAEVMTMLNLEFIKWVAIAFVIACPIAWYAMHKWLQSFAYKTGLSWWVFLSAGMMAMAVALLTVSWQSWRAATRNPVEALRYE
ncbi:MAG: ABC transporter permease [Bacteroidales bacterium]|nr:ABC transporter permease [Bacteroidales bacterium]MBN2762297.1 ABC transporter permease [Bacteroidales bacterium]